MNALQRLLRSVTYQLYANALIRCVLLAGAAYALTAMVLPKTAWPWLAAGLGFGIGVWQTKLFQNQRFRAIRLIHEQVGEAEYSLPLLDKTNLNLAEQLQLERLNDRISRLPHSVVRWSNLLGYGAVLGFVVVLRAAWPYVQSAAKPRQAAQTATTKPQQTASAEVPPTFQTAEVFVQPPAYTSLPSVRSANLNVSAVVGSQLRWQVRFNQTKNLKVSLVNTKGHELGFRLAGNAYTYQDKLVQSGLYAIKAYWRTAAGRDSVVYQSDFYQLEAQPDLAPKIEPADKNVYRYIGWKDAKTLPIEARISDDFGVSQAFLVATVARGSGENVKFREVKMPLSPARFKQARITKMLDLNALQMAPGDELYYYWAAFDNRQPEPNFSKSDTYFVVYRDTARLDESALATMAMNIMPEYFRSQRQIIIDTEKLIANRKRLDRQTFNSQSNEIGFDQKALRLRYGQFLGEEFEKNIGGAAHDDDHAVAGFSGIDAYTHKHDDGEHDPNETPTAPEPDHDHGHSHGPETGEKDALSALMEQYIHSHDDGELNTFHEQSTRALLKQSVEAMWQSELHLRLYEPEKALPFEKKALELLKQSQMKARTYVRKTGFDPPPIKEKETRLSGDLSKIAPTFNPTYTYARQRPDRLAAEALGYVELAPLKPQQRQQLQAIGSALAQVVISSGLKNWSVLAGLQKLVAGKTLTPTEKNLLKSRLYVLAQTPITARRTYQTDSRLPQAFWQRMP